MEIKFEFVKANGKKKKIKLTEEEAREVHRVLDKLYKPYEVTPWRVPDWNPNEVISPIITKPDTSGMPFIPNVIITSELKNDLK